MKMKVLLPTLSLWMLSLTGCLIQDEDYESTSEVIELKGEIRADLTLKEGTEYLLTGQTLVKPGVTLTIEPGVTIKGLPYDNVGQASVLVIERGAYILAEGTAEKPITFTSAFEEGLPARGLWGGLIILGKAPINKSGGEDFIEGLAGVPYGGDVADDSSGVIKYVRVWYGGRSIGEGNEINGMTFGGVGSKTVVEHCEVAWNNDDGFEFFGGTVNAKYLSVAFVGDDAFDMDQGYQGKLQHLFAILGQDESGRGFEIDNNGEPTYDLEPRTYPTISNVTLIGPQGGNPGGDGSDQLMRLREGTGGDFRNIVAYGSNGVGLRVSDTPTQELLNADSTDAPNNLYFSPNNIVALSAESALHSDNTGKIPLVEIDPALTQVMVEPSALDISNFDPRPSDSTSQVYITFEEVVNDSFFDAVNYSGAFDQELWLENWTWLADNNLLP